jgi:hypothetical protein
VFRDRTRSWIVTGALALGVAAGAATVASAAGGSSDGSTTSHPPPGNPARMSHGPGETLLTGSAASKAKAAALQDVPGATVLRAETDRGDGGAYEVHLRKADGSFVTVKLGSDFHVIRTEDGFGQGGGLPPGGGPPPNDGDGPGA